MPCTHTEDPFVEQFDLDRAALEARGCTTVHVAETCESDFAERLLAIARGLGTPTSMRTGGGVCDVLSPTEAANAKPRSLSKIHGLGEFPLHTDTAHWVTPCHYVMLACLSPGSGNRHTLLMDTQRLQLKEDQSSLLHSTPLRVTNGRNSFFSTILSKSRPFVRFDPGCMTAITPDGQAALGIMSRQNWPNNVEQFRWASGLVLVFDNWRVLHGRANADPTDEDRKLLRITIR